MNGASLREDLTAGVRLICLIPSPVIENFQSNRCRSKQMQNLDGDIIVGGAGGCGLMAALVVAKKSARVLLLEKTDKSGGRDGFFFQGHSRGRKPAPARVEHRR